MKIIYLLILFSFAVLQPTTTFAVSGACSGHGGVDCDAGADYDGSVICNDGWEDSSVNYRDMDMCRTSASSCPIYLDRDSYNKMISGWNQFISEVQARQKETCGYSLDQKSRMVEDYYALCMRRTPNVDCAAQRDSDNLENRANYDTCLTLDPTGAIFNARLKMLCLAIDKTPVPVFVQETPDQLCQKQVGLNSYSKDGSCYCSKGYSYYKETSRCIADEVYCPLRLKNSHSEPEINLCVCNDGYYFNEKTELCEVEVIKAQLPPTPLKKAESVKPVVKTEVKKELRIESTEEQEIISTIPTRNERLVEKPKEVLRWYQKILNWFK